MNLAIRSEIFLMSFFVLLIVLIRLNKDKRDLNYQMKLFIFLVVGTMVEVVLELLSWLLDGSTLSFAWISSHFVNSSLFAFNLLPLIYWLLYVDYELFYNVQRNKKLKNWLMGLLFINVIIAYSSPITKAYYYLGENNEYYRGIYFFVGQIFYFSLFFAVGVLVIIYRRRVPKKVSNAMIAFIIPPIFGVILQQLFFGMPTIWASVTLSTLICYMGIQSQMVETDYLSGLYNRRYLENYLDNMVKDTDKLGAFAIMMIDIDDFKKINDTYGHIIGDRAIEITANILKRFFMPENIVARYGGDEFVAVIKLHDETDIEKIKEELYEKVDSYNKSANEPFTLSLSSGCYKYNKEDWNNIYDFLSHVDKLMYQEKNEKKFEKINISIDMEK